MMGVSFNQESLHMPDFITTLLENPFSQPFLLIGTILFWGGVVAFVLALFQIGTIRRALGLMVLALLLSVVHTCTS